jgi:hypothetical protein
MCGNTSVDTFTWRGGLRNRSHQFIIRAGVFTPSRLILIKGVLPMVSSTLA